MATKAAAYAAGSPSTVSTAVNGGVQGTFRKGGSPRHLPPLHPVEAPSFFSPPAETRLLSAAGAFAPGSTAGAPTSRSILSRSLLQNETDPRQQQIAAAQAVYNDFKAHGGQFPKFPPPNGGNGSIAMHPQQNDLTAARQGPPHLDTGAPAGVANPASPTATGATLTVPSTGRTLEPPSSRGAGASPLSSSRATRDAAASARIAQLDSPTAAGAAPHSPSIGRTLEPPSAGSAGASSSNNGNPKAAPASPDAVSISMPKNLDPHLVPVTHLRCGRRTLIGIFIITVTLVATGIGLLVCKLRKTC